MATSTTSPQPNAPGGMRPFRILLVILMLAIVSALSIGGTWYIMNLKYQHAANPVQIGVGQPTGTGQALIAHTERANAPPTAPIFVTLEPFTVTIEDEQSERILRAGITLRAADDGTRQRIQQYMPEVRNRIIMLLSSQSPSALRTAEGRTAIAQGIAKALNQPFHPLPESQRINDVLFTEFVVQ